LYPPHLDKLFLVLFYNIIFLDAGISDKADRYINQPEARPPLNSDEIMHGYTDGCSTSNNNSDAKDKNGTLTTLQ
jgi:hypothetical protein